MKKILIALGITILLFLLVFGFASLLEAVAESKYRFHIIYGTIFIFLFAAIYSIVKDNAKTDAK